MVLLALISLLLHFPATEPAALYLSTDQGNEWTPFTDGLPADVEIRFVTEQAGTLYLGAHGYGVYVLAPGADVWEQRSTGLPLENEHFPLHPLSLVVRDELMILGTFYDGIYVSTDQGNNWRQASPEPYAVTGFVFTDEGILASSHEGIFHSTDGGTTWQLRGAARIRINALAEHNGRIIVARQNGLGVLEEDGVKWSDQTSEWALLQLLQQGEYVYALNYRNEIFRSKDGLSWEVPTEEEKTECTGLPDAVWGGYRPSLLEGVEPGLVTPTSRGWLVGPRSGC
ncbi:MAG: hypothetical protein AAFZ52_04945 [Bacteroidota bacterium]